MPKSRDPADYFEVDLQLVRAGGAVPVDLHLHFSLSSHFMLWLRSGDEPTEEFLTRYLARGLTKVWIRLEDREAWLKYLGPKSQTGSETQASANPAPDSKSDAPAAVAAAAAAPASTPANAPTETPARTEEGALLAAALTSPALNAEQKRAIVGETAREMLREATRAKTVAEQKEKDRKAWATIQDILDAVADDTGSAVSETWKVAEVDPDLEHSVNVATYAVIFAMAFGKIESDLIADLALAGLLHDIGVSQVPASLAAQSWKSFNSEQAAQYSEHVGIGLDLLARHAPSVNSRVRTVIQQHHEKFDGTGFPQRLGGFKVDDVSQLVAMANLLHAMSSGQWDGIERPLKESFETLEKLEKVRSFPEYFNPDVYTAVMRWIRNAPNDELPAQASDIVLKQVKGMMQKPQ